MSGAQLEQRDTGSRIGQLAVAVGPPTLWGLRFLFNYAAMPWACTADGVWLLHLVTALTLGLLLALGRLAYGYRRTGSGVADESAARTRFMGLFGMMSAALFAAVVSAEWLATVMIDPCLTAGPLVPH
jgi:hypothetical protein